MVVSVAALRCDAVASIAGPTCLHLAVHRTSIAIGGVTVVAFFIAGFDTIATGFGGTSVCIALPAFFHFTAVGAAIARDVVTVVTFFVAGDDAIAALVGDTHAAQAVPAWQKFTFGGTS